MKKATLILVIALVFILASSTGAFAKSWQLEFGGRTEHTITVNDMSYDVSLSKIYSHFVHFKSISSEGEIASTRLIMHTPENLDLNLDGHSDVTLTLKRVARGVATVRIDEIERDTEVRGVEKRVISTPLKDPIAEEAEVATLYLTKDDALEVEMDNVTYQLIIVNLQSNYLDFSSIMDGEKRLPVEFTVKLYMPEWVDLNRDGFNDIKLTLNRVARWEAEVEYVLLRADELEEVPYEPVYHY